MNFKVQAFSLTQAIQQAETTFKEEIIVPMPYEAQLLDAGYLTAEGKEVVVWAQFLVEHEKNLVNRRFRVIMDGREMSLEYLWKYFKTVRSPIGFFTYHLFVHHG